jgi:hypothetical protein
LPRYLLLQPVWADRLYLSGITICDAVENQQVSYVNGAFGQLDVVLPAFAACPNGANVAPIDAAASAVMMGAPLYSVQTGRLA